MITISVSYWWVSAAVAFVAGLVSFESAHRLVLHRQPGEGEPVTPRWYKRLIVGVPTLGLVLLLVGASWAPVAWVAAVSSLALGVPAWPMALHAQRRRQDIASAAELGRVADERRASIVSLASMPSASDRVRRARRMSRAYDLIAADTEDTGVGHARVG